ncbi:MAG TPA: dipeptidase [Candidatus Limnocylindria bacterium]|jgi:acetylornithine deacetylase/succinyl-diaminopimelate desuccinylase-like protein|nr:dipeptidase [Candidatus Limnocylindria bacterium]
MTSQIDADRMTDAALAYVRDHDAEHLAQLDEFLRIESVSADPERNGEVRRAAAWIVAQMESLGIERATIHETSAHPIVTGEWMHAGDAAPTVLVYCHYDVQPADPLDEWIRPPFEPRHEDERVYARGAGDDKGQLFMHLKAVEAWMRTAGRLPVNLRFFFEGDEEVGSEPIEEFIAAHPDLLRADVCVVSDGDTFDDEGTPAIGYGLRGIAYWEIKVRGPRQDVHSGQYGGGVDNPANVLVRLLASLVDQDGRVAVPGFYDDVRDLTPEEREAYAALPFDERAWADETGVPAPMGGERGYTLKERLSARPTFDVNGIWGGYQGEGAKTIIPAWAAAKVSTRLVPDQDYRAIERAMKAHIEAIAPPTVRTEVRIIHGGAPAITPLDHPGVAPARRALTAGFGREPLFQRSGGSVPVVAALDAQLGLKTLMLGFANPTGNFHAPNEWMSLLNIRNGLASLVHLWAELGGMSAEELRG